MEHLQHFSHEHLLILVQLQANHNYENSDKENEDENEDENEIMGEDGHGGKCMMCDEEIYSFHLCYYSCKDCDYSLHTFCAQLPKTQQNHPLHPNHSLTLSEEFQLHDDYYKFEAEWACDICEIPRKMFYNYHCSICNFNMDIICATMSKQKMDHPSHHHHLQRYFAPMISCCNACRNEHSGTFYHCTTCSWFKIHLDCALLPVKLLIQQATNDSFTHSHVLTLAYSFPYMEKRAKFHPQCRVCGKGFLFDKWHYRCSKCRYYAHVKCATSTREAFISSILMPAGLGKTYKNFKDDDHPNLVRCPFPNESFNLLKQHFINKGDLLINGKITIHTFTHPHPLILVETILNGSVSLHDPMKNVELLCDGCVRPITDAPFYKCSQHHCGFVLHEWCSRLPSEIQDKKDHPDHMLVLLPKIPTKPFGVFVCDICRLTCNGFAYGCKQCNFYVDINCGFIPDIITHEAHPNHLLLRTKASNDLLDKFCNACQWDMNTRLGFYCLTCEFYLHLGCALLLPRMIRHKYDKHPLSIRYHPAENYSSEYFCEICEEEFDPELWFYHCHTCASFMHTACAPLKLQCELSTYTDFNNSVFLFSNVKFGGTHEIKDHQHPVTFIQGINADGQCIVCHEQLQYAIILKCFECNFVIHLECANILT